MALGNWNFGQQKKNLLFCQHLDFGDLLDIFCQNSKFSTFQVNTVSKI